MTQGDLPEIAPSLADRLRCPETGQDLTLAEPDALAALNARIAQGGLTTTGGRPLDRPLSRLLVRQDGALGFSADPFPQLLPDDAIDLSALS